MSSEAVAWAFKLNVKPSSIKFTLVALCECANYKTGRITPSIAHLCEITGQDRKTVIANVAELERRGIIADTGERCGATKQIKVYNAAIGTVPETEQFQKRNSPENGRKQSQKRDTEPSLEPSIKNTVKRACVISDDWKPAQFTLGTKSRAVVDDWSPGELAGHLEHFTAHHRGKGSKFIDWQDAWSTWVLNNRRFSNGRSNQNIRTSGGNGPDKRSGIAKACDGIIAGEFREAH